MENYNEYKKTPRSTPIGVRIRTKNERNKEILMYSKIIDFTTKVYPDILKDIPKGLFNYYEIFGYLDNYGYYVISNIPGDRGPFSIDYGTDIDEAFMRIIDEYIIRNFKEESNNNNLENFFQEESEERWVAYYNYYLDKWKKYYDGIIPERIIEFYQDKINKTRQDDSWYYDNIIKKYIRRR